MNPEARDWLSRTRDVIGILATLGIFGIAWWYAEKTYRLNRRHLGGGSFDDIGGRP